MCVSIAIKDLMTAVYIIANLHVTYAIQLSVTHTQRNGYNARIARNIVDLSSVMKSINNRKVTNLDQDVTFLNIVTSVAYSIELNGRVIKC